MYMRLGIWRIGGMGYNFVKNVDLFFLNIPPYHGVWGIFLEQHMQAV